MSAPIHIIEARFLTVGDIISWKGKPTSIGTYKETEAPSVCGSHYDAIELQIFINNDEDLEDLIVVPVSEKIRVLSPFEVMSFKSG